MSDLSPLCLMLVFYTRKYQSFRSNIIMIFPSSEQAHLDLGITCNEKSMHYSLQAKNRPFLSNGITNYRKKNLARSCSLLITQGLGRDCPVRYSLPNPSFQNCPLLITQPQKKLRRVGIEPAMG